MSCKPICRLCDKIRISTAVNIVGGNVVINIPSDCIRDGEKICLVIAQTIPTTATIGSNVFITLSGNPQQYQLVTACCRPVTVCGIRTRTRYSLVLETSATGGVFKMLGKPCCSPSNRLPSISGTTPVTPTTASTTETEPSVPTTRSMGV